MIRPTVHIWREGNAIKLGHHQGPGLPARPLDEPLVGFLAEHMEYDQVEFLFGREQFLQGDGRRRRVRTVHKRLWLIDEDGLFLCGAGYLDWVVEKLINLGYELKYRRVEAPRPRPDWATLDLERAYERYTFRAAQVECFEAILARALAGLGGVVDACVGFGKSDIIAPISLALPKARIMVAVRKLDLVNKTVAQLKEYLPSVGQVDGAHKEFGHRITVYSLDSLEHFDGDADLLFFDEAHEAAAPRYARVLGSRLNQGAAFALTATPEGRVDGADARLEALFGPTIFYLPYARAEQLGLVVPIRVLVHPVDMDRNPAADLEDDTARKRHGLWRNRARNKVIAGVAAGLPAEEQALILVAKMDHLVHLHRHLEGFTPVWAESSNKSAEDFHRRGLFPDYEKMTPRRRAWLHDAFKAGDIRRAVATIWDQGVSFDGLQHLFWVKGGSSAIAATQGPGRVSRIDAATGKACGLVHEFDDRFDSGFHNQFLTRVRHYRKHGWTIVSEDG